MIHRQPGSNGDTNAGRTRQGQPPSGSLRRRPHHPSEFGSRPRRRASAICCSCAVRFPDRRTGSSSCRKTVKVEAPTASASNAERHRRQGQSRTRSRGSGSVRGAISRARRNAIFRAVYPRNGQPARRHALDQSSATKSAAAAANRGSRRAPAARAKVRSARRNGATAAWSSARSRAATSASSTRKSAALAFWPRSPTASRTAPSPCSTPRTSRLTKTADFATLLFGAAKAAKTGPQDADRVRARASETSATLLAPGHRNLATVAVTHSGALDVKDVLRYERLVFTTGAYDALDRPLRRRRRSPHGRSRDVIVAPRITEKSMAEALLNQYTFDVNPHATKTQIRHAIEEIFKVERDQDQHGQRVAASRGTSRAAASRRRGKQSDCKKAIVTLKAGPEDRTRRRQLLRAISMASKKISARHRRRAASSPRWISPISRRSIPRSRCSRSRRSTPAATTTATSRCAIRAAARASSTASSTSSAPRTPFRRRSRRSSTIPNRIVPHRARQLPRRREALYPRAARPRRSATSIESGADADIKIGNACRSRTFRSVPSSTTSSCAPARAASSCVRPASSAQLMAKEDEYSQVRMPSGEVRKIHINCRATIGQLGNIEHENEVIGKAGRSATWASARAFAVSR